MICFLKQGTKRKCRNGRIGFSSKVCVLKLFLMKESIQTCIKNCFIFTLEVFLIITHRSQAPCKFLNFIIFTKVMILTLIVFNTMKRKTFGTISIGTIPLKLLDKELAIGQR